MPGSVTVPDGCTFVIHHWCNWGFITGHEVAGLLNKMQLHAEHSESKEKQTIFTISVPLTRSDILHPCDVAEDVAIAYGYNEIPKMKLPSLKPQSLNQFSDLIRTEILNWLMWCCLVKQKMLVHQIAVILHLYCGSTSGFELVHGLVDRIMEVIGTPFVIPGDKTGYCVQSSDEPKFLPGRQATVIYKGKQIGTFVIVHPQVLDNFDIPESCSFVVLDIESFL